MEQRTESKHTLMLERRGRMDLTGVTEVISFDEQSVIADTDCGVIIIKGENLHIDSLDLEKGNMSLEGDIDSITYEESDSFFGTKGSFLNRLFR